MLRMNMSPTIFRIEEKAKQEISMKQTASKSSWFLAWLSLQP
jgi:hypothetical protein